MEHPLALLDTASLVKIVGYNIPFITINTVAPAVDISIKLVVAVFTVIGIIHTIYCNAKRLENELKNKKDGKHKSE